MSFGGAIKLTGENEYKKALQQIKQNLKEVSSEMKVVTASYGKNDNSIKGLTAKQEALTKKLSVQKEKLSTLKSQYSVMAKQYQTNTAKHNSLIKTYEEEKAELDRIGKELGENSKEYQDQKAKVDGLEKEVMQSTKAQEANEKAMSNLRTEMNKAEAEVIKTTNELDKLETQLIEAKTAEEKAKSATEQLTSSIDKQQTELNNLKAKYKEAVLQYGENSKEAKSLGQEIENLSTELATNKKRMADAESSADKFDKSLKDVDSTTDKVDGGFTVLKGTLANLASAGIQKVVDGMKQLGRQAIESWQDYDEGADIIIAKTGATGKSAQGLEKVYKSVSQNVVASQDEIGTAVGEVNTRFGVTGKQLDSLSTDFLKFAKLNDTDVNNAIDKTQSAMRAWGIETKDAGNMLDLLNKAGQDTGVSVDKLADMLVTNAPALKNMGMNASDASMFLANLEKNGVDASSTMAGLKKALANASKEGKPMSVAMSEMEKSIKGASSETEAIQIATELFGTKAGASIATAVRSGQLSFKELGTSMKDYKGNVNKTFEETLDAPDKFSLAVQNIKLSLGDVTNKVMSKYAPEIEKAISGIEPVIKSIVNAIGKAFAFLVNHSTAVKVVLGGVATALGAITALNFANKVQNMIKAMKGLEAVTKKETLSLIAQKVAMVASTVATKAMAVAQRLLNLAMNANPIMLIISGIMVLAGAFILLWKKSEKFRKFWIGLWKKIKETAKPIIDGLKKWFKDAWDNIKKIWSKVVAFFKGIWNGIKAVFSGVITFYRSIFQGAWNAIKTIWNGVKKFFSNVWAGIKAVFSGVVTFFKNIFTSAVSGIKAVFNGVKKFFSGIWSGIKNVFGNVGSWFKSKFQGAWKAIKGVFSGWGKFFGGLWTTIKDKFTKLGSKIGGAVGKAVKSGINGIISTIEKTINGAIKLINGAIKLINKIPGVEIGKVKKIELPRLSRGGVLERGQVGLLEGDGAEAVVPLENNARWIRKVANDMKTAIVSSPSKNSAVVEPRRTLTYEEGISAVKSALADMKIILDDDVAGRFVEKTVARAIYF